MIDPEQYKNFLLSHMTRAKLVSGGKEVVCKCMYCDDRHEHMYISIPQSPNEPSFYNCFRCPAQGVVTPATLNDWNCYDDMMAIALLNHNKNIKIIPKGTNRNVLNINYHYITINDGSIKKLDYINKRLGTKLSFRDTIQLKICLNIYDILNQNSNLSYTRNARDIQLLNEYFLGFISLDNYFINFRRIVDEGIVSNKYLDSRYFNYTLAENPDNTERFYTIPFTINFASPNRIPIHIAEGPFDCLSIYLNVRNKAEGIYTSISGNNYASLVRHFVLAIGLHYSEIHIYPDNDKSGNDWKMKEVTDLCRPLGIPVWIHRNMKPGEKDFGVTPDRIQETIYQL